MALYNQNLLFLKNNAPDIYNKVLHEVPLCEELSINYSNDNIIVTNKTVNCYLRSIYDIEQEMRWTFKDVPRDTKTIMIFGIGMLDTLVYILKNFKQVKTIIFIEPSLQIFDAMLHKLDLVKILGKARNIELIFTINFSPAAAANDAAKLLHGKDSYAMLSLISYSSLFKKYFTTFLGRFKELLIEENINLGNSEISYYQWITECISNRNIKSPPVDIFREVISGKPVILVGAGPSLKKNMHLLKDAANKAIIIAGGTAVKILNNAGIRAHFNVALDPADSDIYDSNQNNNIPLLFSYQTNHETLQRYCGPKAFYLTFLDSLNFYAYNKAGYSFMAFRTGPSVVNSMHDIAGGFGASQIIFIGEDMCFYDDDMYSNLSIKASNMSGQGKLFELEDIYGNKVTSNYSYYSIKESIQKINKVYKNIPTFNATEGGLNIEGIPNVTLKEMIENLPNLEYFSYSKINNIIDNISKDDCISPQDVYDKILLADEIEKIKSIIEFTKHLLEDLSRLITNKAQEKKILSKIKQVLKQESKLTKNGLFGEVILKFCKVKFDILSNKYDSDIESKDINRKANAVINAVTARIEVTESYVNLIKL